MFGKMQSLCDLHVLIVKAYHTNRVYLHAVMKSACLVHYLSACLERS